MSMLEALFEHPQLELLDGMPLTAEIKTAVIERSGVLGDILSAVLSREQDDAPEKIRFDAGAVNRAWLDALGWAADTQGALR
jgi:c-di-GMP-related signal transduction protein